MISLKKKNKKKTKNFPKFWSEVKGWAKIRPTLSPLTITLKRKNNGEEWMRSKIFQKGDSNHTLDNLGNTERAPNMLSEGMNTLVWKVERVPYFRKKKC